MKLLTKSIFILMLGLVPISMSAADYTDEASAPEQSYVELSTSNLLEQTAGDDTKVNVVYLKDKDGKPYIISIRSEDERVNQMIREMISSESEDCLNPIPSRGDNTLAITFYYDNIR